MKLVIATGGFDPVHSGHIKYLQSAKALGDVLLVGLNSDAWIERKKGRAFMPYAERELLLWNLKCVDSVKGFNDTDGSAIALLEWAKSAFPYAEEIIFANGGDRTEKNIPEMSVTGIKFEFGVGGDNKANSSSWILEEWKAPKTARPWGYYRVLHEVPGTKVKELTIEPGQSISMQRHAERSEFWHISSGRAIVNAQLANGYALPPKTLETHDSYYVPLNEWHKLSNPFSDPVKIVEIQYGTTCDELDIERK